jgi:hypothetical protein
MITGMLQYDMYYCYLLSSTVAYYLLGSCTDHIVAYLTGSAPQYERRSRLHFHLHIGSVGNER